MPKPGFSLTSSEAPSDASVRQLLRTALPDKGRCKASGWWEQTDFLVTRSHVDEDGDSFHDGVFISVWKQWDFWLALPATGPAPAGGWGAKVWTLLRTPAPPVQAEMGLLCQYRTYDGQGQAGMWQPLEDDAAPDRAASLALQKAWSMVLNYWQAAELERRAGWPLRTQLHARLDPSGLQALASMSIFTDHYNDWGDPERSGWWEEDVWVGVRQAGLQGGRRQALALKLGWHNGQEAPGDVPDDAHACYQIELVPQEDASAAPGTAHPPGLLISYSQRQSQPRTPLPSHAALHVAQLLGMLDKTRAHLQAREWQAQQAQDRLLQALELATVQLPGLVRLPPYHLHDSDEDIFGPPLLDLSRTWQAAGREYAAAMRACWAAANPEPGGTADPADTRGRPAVRDARAGHAAAALQLARRVNALGDAGLMARFHHRFAFAPAVFAPHAARHGQAVHVLLWLGDDSLWVLTEGRATGTDTQCWQIDLTQRRVIAWPPSEPVAAASQTQSIKPLVLLQGTTVQGDAQGELQALTDDGQVLWRHCVGGAVRCIAVCPADAQTLAVGTSDGSVVLLRKAAGPDPWHASTSRLHETQRVLFWSDADAPLWW